MNNVLYASIVSSFMYAQVYTHPDIAYAIGVLGRYLSDLIVIGSQTRILQVVKMITN